MKIKRRHIKMARAAWRMAPLWGIWVDAETFGHGPGNTPWHRWHRAAKGKHQ